MTRIERIWPLLLIWVAVPTPLYIWLALWLIMG